MPDRVSLAATPPHPRSVRAAEELAIGIRDLRAHLDRFLLTGDAEHLGAIPSVEKELERWLGEAKRAAVTPREQELIGRLARNYDQFVEGIYRLDRVPPEGRGRAVRDLIAAIEAGYDDATGRFAADDFGQSLAILGLACTGFDAPAGALEALLERQLDDGGWGFEGASDPDTSAIALQAVIAAGTTTSDSAVAAAIAYFRAAQASDGGWGFTPDESNTSSTTRSTCWVTCRCASSSWRIRTRRLVG